MRRWRVVVIDDNPEGSLEAVLLSPWVLFHPLKNNATDADIEAATSDNLLNKYLPLAPGERYADWPDADFQISTSEDRRRKMSRPPIIDVERNFARAWRLVSEMIDDPPDIVFLDVLFDRKAATVDEVEAIIDEIQSNDRIGRSGRPTVREVMGRGGLFLLGKLLRSRGDVRRMPLVVLYSASRDVQVDFRPFEYASNGRFEVVAKDVLRNDSERRKEVFHRRIRDYFNDRTLRADDVRAALDLLGSQEAINGNHDLLVHAFSYPIGSGWCFGAMFVAETVAYLSSEPSRRSVVVDELARFLGPFTSYARSAVELLQSSPARLHSHRAPVTFATRPSWAKPGTGDVVPGTEKLTLSLSDVANDPVAHEALQAAVRRLPSRLRERLGAELEKASGDSTERAMSQADTPAHQRLREARLDAFVGELKGYDPRWDEVLKHCRVPEPARKIVDFLREFAKNDHLAIVTDSDQRGRNAESPSAANLELVLEPGPALVKEPLASLLKAIAGSVSKSPSGGPERNELRVGFVVHSSPPMLDIRLTHRGRGFAELRYYDPRVRGGDLSTALIAAAPWFDVEIHSGGEMRRPTAPVGVVEPSPFTEGTSFVIRIPAYSMEEE
jgi:hypothetical protein